MSPTKQIPRSTQLHIQNPIGQSPFTFQQLSPLRINHPYCTSPLKMRSTTPFVLLGLSSLGLVTGRVVNCNSFGIPDGNVAGYVSLDDYNDAGGFKTFVKVARKSSPNPHGKRKRSLFGRPSSQSAENSIPARNPCPGRCQTSSLSTTP